MADWEKTLQALREQFIEGSTARLDRIRSALERLGSNPSDAEAVADLRLAFHGFSGLGGSFGFPKVTMLGIQGEKQCDALAALARNPGPEELAALGELLARLRSELGAGVVSPATVEDLPGPRRREGLVVEGDDALRKDLARVVDRAGLVVRTAATRAEALESLDLRMPDAVLVDAELPDGSGYALVERIREMAGGERLAVLLIAGLANVLDRVEAIHCGADGLFEKPLDAESVGRRLQQLLERARGEAPRVLSVEDDPDQGSFLKSVLESAGYEVSVVAAAAEFEESLIAFQPDLVLMDILLPGNVSGYDLARYLRQDERYATLPVLFLTTEQQMHVRIEALKAGGDDHLVKPISPGLLLSTVAARIERARFLKDLVERDGLTRLLTHTAFFERVRAALARRRRRPNAPSAALAVLDLDHFKKVNDTWGHPVGDRVLTALSALLRSRLRQSDTIGRLGGEEFGALLEDLSAEDAVRLFERLLADFIAIEHRGSGEARFHVSFSAGVAMSGSAEDLPGWLEAADQALYEAKNAGRSRVVSKTSPTIPGPPAGSPETAAAPPGK
jgi:diguanylate cyclase (GGDEF)-like protein